MDKLYAWWLKQVHEYWQSKRDRAIHELHAMEAEAFRAVGDAQRRLSRVLANENRAAVALRRHVGGE